MKIERISPLGIFWVRVAMMPCIGLSLFLGAVLGLKWVELENFIDKLFDIEETMEKNQ